jgi:5-formyltetrahydrofolate cyclo-ligase
LPAFANHRLDPLVNIVNRATLRQQLRHTRRSLSHRQQHQAATSIDRHIANSGLLLKHRDIAFYLANDGEIDPAPLLLRAHRLGIRCYLPVLAPNNRLWFIRYRPGDKLNKNRYGIAEPFLRKRHRKPWSLGLVLLPLVGFDRQGGRMGMGGGYYDRSLHRIGTLPAMNRPRLIGLAHQCQEVPKLELESWDIPLSQVVTDVEVIKP